MKTNLFRVAFFALATTFMAACSQEENPVSEQQETLQVLNVTADATGFASTETARATDDLSTGATTFEEGDTIGVYVIENEKAIIKNMKLERNAEGKWAGTTPLYVYDGATYLAYFPYSENMSAASITSIDDLKTQLAANWDADQSTLTKYQACDGMVSTGALTTTEGSTTASLKFSFSHVLSMIQLNIPTRKYITTEAQGSYKYNAPSPLTLTMTATNSTESVEYKFYFPEEGDGDIRRIIVKPGTYNITGKIYDVLGWKPVTFEATATLTAGQYQGYKLTYTDAPANERTVRDLKIGDYFYSDGSICPCDNENFIIPGIDNGCVGIIYSLTTTDIERNNGWTHGQVLALKRAGTQYNWVSKMADAANGYTPVCESLEAAYSHKDGYSVTQYYITNNYVTIGGSDKSYRAMWEAVNFNQALPEGTSGWYMPAFGQIADVMINLGDVSDYSYSNYQSENSNTNITNGWQKIDNLLTNLGGEAMVLSTNTVLWVATEFGEGTGEDAGKYYASIADIGAGKLKVTKQQKRCADSTVTGSGDNKRGVRPVFAF